MRPYDLAVYINSTKIKDIKTISIKRSSDMKMSKAEIVLKNANLKHINTGSTDFVQLSGIEMDSPIEIYADYNTIPDDIRTSTNADVVAQRRAALIFNGNITAIDLQNSSKKTDIKLVATDSMLLVMNKVRIANYRSTSLTNVLINLIQQAFEDKGTYTNYEIPSGLPTIDYYATHRPLHEHILKVSSPDYTGFTRNAIFKLIPDPDNATFPYKFIWLEPKDTASTTLNGAITATDTTITLTSVTNFPPEGAVTIGNEVIRYTSISGNDLVVASNGRGFGSSSPSSHLNGTAVTSVMTITTGKTGPGIKKLNSIKIKKSEDDAINMLIMRLGTDLFGRSITHYAYDTNSETVGLRMKIVDWKYVAENYFANNVGSKTNVATTLSNPSYPATLALNDASNLATGTNYIRVLVENNPEIIKVNYSGSGNNVTISSAGDRGQFNTSANVNIEAGTVVADYTAIVSLGNTAIRTAIKELAREQYAREFFRFQNPRWTAQIDMEGNAIGPLGLVNITAQDIGINSFPLRIKDITHTLNKTSWTTTLKLEEDELKV